MTKQNEKNFPPKGYKISKFHLTIFDALMNVFGKNKTDLAYAILSCGNTGFNPNIIKELPQYHSYELFELIMEGLKKINLSFEELKGELNSERINELKNMGGEWDGPREYRHFRLNPEYISFIENYSVKKYCDTIELAISIFVNKLTDEEYNLMKCVFQTLIKDK